MSIINERHLEASNYNPKTNMRQLKNMCLPWLRGTHDRVHMATGCHDVLSILSTYFSATRVYTPACGRTCDMGHPERRERDRKVTARNILGWYTVNCVLFCKKT